MSQSNNPMAMVPDNVKLLPAVEEDLRRLDHSDRVVCIKALIKLAKAPSQYGEPLASHQNTRLGGFRKIRVGRLRIVYRVVAPEKVEVALVIAVGPRSDEEVYAVAERRRRLAEGFIQEYLEAVAKQRK